MNTPSMFRNRFRRKKSEPKCYEDIHHSCTVRFLDDSQPITVTFQVSRCDGKDRRQASESRVTRPVTGLRVCGTDTDRRGNNAG